MSLSALWLERCRRRGGQGKDRLLESPQRSLKPLNRKGCIWPEKERCCYQKKGHYIPNLPSSWPFLYFLWAGWWHITPKRWRQRCDLIFPSIIFYFSTQGAVEHLTSTTKDHVVLSSSLFSWNWFSCSSELQVFTCVLGAFCFLINQQWILGNYNDEFWARVQGKLFLNSIIMCVNCWGAFFPCVWNPILCILILMTSQ